MVNAMSDLSVTTAPESVVSSSRKATAQTEAKPASQPDVGDSARKPSSADVTNFVTSPKGVVDPQSGVYVLQYRDGETGEVEMQYPSKKAVAAYQRSDSAAVASQTSTDKAGPSVPQNSGGESTGTGAEVSSVSTTTTTTASSTTGGTASGTGTGSTSTDVDV